MALRLAGPVARLASRRLAPVGARFASDALGPTSFKGPAHQSNPNVGTPKNLQQESFSQEDLVLEEKKFGYEMGYPFKRESEIWANPDDPNQLLAERSELFWDDGTAEPEWFVDRGSAGGSAAYGSAAGRPWAVSTEAAAAQCAGAFGLIGVVFGVCWLVDDKFRPAAHSSIHSYPVDMHKQFGIDALPKDGTPVLQGQKRVQQYGIEPPDDDDE